MFYIEHSIIGPTLMMGRWIGWMGGIVMEKHTRRAIVMSSGNARSLVELEDPERESESLPEPEYSSPDPFEDSPSSESSIGEGS